MVEIAELVDVGRSLLGLVLRHETREAGLSRQKRAATVGAYICDMFEQKHLAKQLHASIVSSRGSQPLGTDVYDIYTCTKGPEVGDYCSRPGKIQLLTRSRKYEGILGSSVETLDLLTHRTWYISSYFTLAVVVYAPHAEHAVP